MDAPVRCRLRNHKVSEWDVQTQLGHKRPGQTESYAACDPDYLKDAADAREGLMRVVCVRLLVREKKVVRRNGKEMERNEWWAL